ncbi:MAG: DUF998 domain-containing protein [Gemmobacter sp.]
MASTSWSCCRSRSCAATAPVSPTLSATVAWDRQRGRSASTCWRAAWRLCCWPGNSGRRRLRPFPACLLLVMLARIAIALFPNDPRGTPRTRSGQVHHAATIIGFACACMTTTEATPLLAATVQGPLHDALIWLKHLIMLGFAAVAATISAPLRRCFGLAERLYLDATALWFLTASLTLPPLWRRSCG